MQGWEQQEREQEGVVEGEKVIGGESGRGSGGGSGRGSGRGSYRRSGREGW